LDGYKPSIGFIHADLRPLQSIKIVYERRKAIAQSKNKKEIYEKYVRRERNREKDFINKLVAGLRRLFQNTVHVFEDLDKEDLVSRRRAEKVRRKSNAKTPWRSIHRRMSEVALQLMRIRGTPLENAPNTGLLWRPKRSRSSNALDVD
jgi:putative transposase